MHQIIKWGVIHPKHLFLSFPGFLFFFFLFSAFQWNTWLLLHLLTAQGSGRVRLAWDDFCLLCFGIQAVCPAPSPLSLAEMCKWEDGMLKRCGFAGRAEWGGDVSFLKQSGFLRPLRLKQSSWGLEERGLPPLAFSELTFCCLCNHRALSTPLVWKLLL